MNPISTQFSTSSMVRTPSLHSAIKDKLPLEEIKHYFNPRSLNEKIDGKLPLDLAILNNDEELIVALINAGAKFEDNEAAFFASCGTGKVEVVRAFIKNRLIDKDVFSFALRNATKENQIEVVRLLLQCGANQLQIIVDGCTDQHLACNMGHYEILKMFIEIGKVDVNDRNNPARNTFLMKVSSRGEIDLVNWLLDKGADFQLSDPKGFTPFLLACGEGHLEVAQRLYTLNKAKFGNNNKLIQNFLNITYGDNQFCVLQSAAQKGKVEVVKWLLKEGADPFSPCLNGATPWQAAWGSCSLDIIKAFYETGKIDLNQQFNGTGILHFFTGRNKPEMIRWLLDKGANPSISAEGICTPIEYAFDTKLEEVAKAFINKDFSNINKGYGSKNYTPLSLAAQNRMYPLAKWLLDNGADPSIESTDGSPFTFACWSGELSIAQLLYDRSKSPEAKFKLDLNKQYGPHGFTALMAASANPDVIKWLLENGADPFIKTKQDYDLFSKLCKYGELNGAKIIFQLGIDLDQPYSENKVTALHLATTDEHAEFVEWLLANGADPFIKSKGGDTPFDCAIRQKKPEIIKAYINALQLMIDDSGLTVGNFIEIVFPLIELLLKNGIPLSTFELSIHDHFPVSLKNRIKVLGICSHLINWANKLDSKSISEKIEELIALDVADKLTPLKDNKLTSNFGQEILDHFIPLLYKQFPQLRSKRPGLISINKELFRVIREIVFKYKWMCDIQYNDNIKLKIKSETSLEKLFEFIITLYNTLQQQRAIIEDGNKNDTVAIVSKSETKVLPKPAEPAPQIKPVKPHHISSSPSVNVPTTQKKPVKNKKVKGRKNQKVSIPKPQVITTASHQKEHPSQVILAEPLPPLFPPQIIPLKTSAFDLESLVVDPSQPRKEDHQLSELKKILSSPEPLHLSLFDEVCKINRDHHQVPGFFAFDSWLIHSSHKIFHSDVMCDLFLQFVKQGYQDPFKPEQLLESFSTKHFIDELAKIDGDRKQTIRNMIKILPSLSSRHAISAAILIIGEQTARSTDELSDIIEICMKYKVYRNLRHRLENQPEPVPFEREGVLEEGLINPGIDWEEMLNELINELPADLEKLKNSKIMKD